MYINFPSSLPIVFFISFGPPVDKLASFIPEVNFIGSENIISLVGQILIATGGFVCAYLVTLE
jgi:hypothetical protein